MLQKELMLMRQINQNNVSFVSISILEVLVINYCNYYYCNYILLQLQPYLCNGCHAVSMMAYELKNIAILNAKYVDYRCILCILVQVRLLID